jgi:hypothetical protein
MIHYIRVRLIALMVSLKGYRRTVPIVGSTPQWGAASAWSSPMSTSGLTGSGTLQTLNFYVLP